MKALSTGPLKRLWRRNLKWAFSRLRTPRPCPSCWSQGHSTRRRGMKLSEPHAGRSVCCSWPLVICEQIRPSWGCDLGGRVATETLAEVASRPRSWWPSCRTSFLEPSWNSIVSAARANLLFTTFLWQNATDIRPNMIEEWTWKMQFCHRPGYLWPSCFDDPSFYQTQNQRVNPHPTKQKNRTGNSLIRWRLSF